jgi:hypothetical protein
VLCILWLAGIKAWRVSEANKLDNDLKMEMVARGMSADEIERVLKAKSSDETKSRK